MTKEEFATQVVRASGIQGFPVTTAMLRCLAEDLAKGNPKWWVETQAAWSKRPVAWSEAWRLFLACVHYEVLSDADNPLVAYFPSCGGTDEADPSKPLRQFLADPPKTFWENLHRAQWRPFVPLWAPLWRIAALLFFQKRTLPFYLVEVNSGAGLNLAADAIYPLESFMADLVSARIGLDNAPLQTEDLLHRRWLTAGLLPDIGPVFTELDRAIDVMQGCQKSESNYIQLVSCTAEQAPAFIAKNIPADDIDVGLLVFNVDTTARMDDAHYQRYMNGMLDMMKPWGDRALWLEIENVRGELFSTTVQIRARRMRDGLSVGRVLGSCDLAQRKFDLDVKKASAYLEVPLRK